MWSEGKEGESMGAHQGKEGRGESLLECLFQGLKSCLACEIQCRAFCPSENKKLLNVVGATGEKLKLSNIFPLQVIKTKFEVFLVLRK